MVSKQYLVSSGGVQIELRDRDRGGLTAESCQLDDAKLSGSGNGFRAVVGVEFAEDVAVMDFDCVEGEVEAVGDLLVGQAFGDELEDFEFAVA